jgi:hypothetical protein
MELVENPYLSDFTKKTLLQFNWKDGDPIPATLGDFLLKTKETIPASSRTDVLIDAEKMPAEAVAQVNAMLAEARVIGDKEKARQERQKELQTVTEGMAPNVAAAVEQILGPQIVDDRATMTAAPTQEPAAVPAPQPAPVAVPDEEPEAVPPALAFMPFCPRCGWDMRQKYEVNVTDRDKEDFVACLLGNTRFKRTFELFGGKLRVTLRALLTEETKAIYKQLIIDQQQGVVNSEAEWFAQMMDYRLVCSVESLADKDGKLISVVPEMAEMPFTPDKDNPLATPLAATLDYVNTKVLAQEVTKRLVGTHLRQFQRLVEALEAMALEPSFWTGIE